MPFLVQMSLGVVDDRDHLLTPVDVRRAIYSTIATIQYIAINTVYCTVDDRTVGDYVDYLLYSR